MPPSRTNPHKQRIQQEPLGLGLITPAGLTQRARTTSRKAKENQEIEEAQAQLVANIVLAESEIQLRATIECFTG
jgi:hypothetical protein